MLPITGHGADNTFELGKAVYNFRCYFCHGYSGDAKTLAATFLSPPPANFVSRGIGQLTEDSVVATLQNGRPNTAMKSFQGVLNDDELRAVAHFVVEEFVIRKGQNTKYHTAENGWPDHDRYKIAFPFAKGEIPLSRPWENLSPIEIEGKRLYLGSCVSCHDHGTPDQNDMTWDSRPLSYPRNNFVFSATAPKVDATSSASPYALHEIPPKVIGMTKRERRGERLFQKNCAFCHGADGTGKNWIGQFLEPHPRNLRDPEFMQNLTRIRLRDVIRDGLPGTSMPAWKDVFSESDIGALIAYVSKAFFPLRTQEPNVTGSPQNRASAGR